jgi:SAM-dependent methyltransferase
MKADAAYGAFAYAYDQALGDRFFRAVRKLLGGVLDRYPAAEQTHLDLACGTGHALRFFHERGFRSTGVDVSLPMLRLAWGRGGRVVAGDLRALPLRRRFARITCLYDSLNHLLDRADLTLAFREAARLLAPDGLFLFDMNHPEIYPAIWGMSEPFTAAGEDYSLEIATTFRASEGLGRARVSGWARLPGGERVTIRERQQQRAYSEREIVDSLAAAGLTPVEVMEFDPFREGRRVKLFFVCRIPSREDGEGSFATPA